MVNTGTGVHTETLKCIEFIRLSFGEAHPPERRLDAVTDRTALARIIAAPARIMVVLLDGSIDSFDNGAPPRQLKLSQRSLEEA